MAPATYALEGSATGATPHFPEDNRGGTSANKTQPLHPHGLDQPVEGVDIGPDQIHPVPLYRASADAPAVQPSPQSYSLHDLHEPESYRGLDFHQGGRQVGVKHPAEAWIFTDAGAEGTDGATVGQRL